MSPTTIQEHIVEIVSDSGEGAQKCGQTFGNISAKMNNGVWTVEIIPAEIQPPARTPSGASGIRIRLGSKYITNVGNEGDLVVAFNEQVLYSRIANGAYKKGTVVLLDNKWATDPSEDIQKDYAKAVGEFRNTGLVVYELPIHEACLKIVKDPRKGKNMFVLGMLCRIYNRNQEMGRNEIALTFAGKKEAIITSNQNLFDAGYAFAEEQIPDLFFDIPAADEMGQQKMVVTNGNTAVGLGVLASGMELVSMYPITPATSATHYLAEIYPDAGGFIHQAEDEISAISFAIGASYAGKTACTITSGPGMALKTENIALAVMTEVPLVIVDVQRGGPSTGLPTKIEQADLLSSMYGMPGDAPKIIMAAATIAECFSMVVTARKLAETFRGPVIVLTDANLATGVQPWARPDVTRDMMAPPLDQSEWDTKVAPFEWDEATGLSQRPIPGMPKGEYIITGLSHTKHSKVSYESAENQYSHSMRSRKLGTLQSTLTPPKIHGDESGDMLVIGWGSTWGAITEAVDNLREQGNSVSSIHLRFLSPLEPGLKEIFSRFKKVITVEVNYSDDPDAPMVTDENRRYAQLATLLRVQTLVDVDCWSVVYGHPLQPALIENALQGRLDNMANEADAE